jgi:hypothetical protein
MFCFITSLANNAAGEQQEEEQGEEEERLKETKMRNLLSYNRVILSK